MAYSGTVNQTKVNVAQLIEYAFRETGKAAEEQTPEYINAGKQALFYILQSMSNKGIDLWAIEPVLLGAVQAQTELFLPPGTVKILEANWRYLQTPNVSSTLPVSNPDVGNLFNGNKNICIACCFLGHKKKLFFLHKEWSKLGGLACGWNLNRINWI